MLLTAEEIEVGVKGLLYHSQLCTLWFYGEQIPENTVIFTEAHRARG